MIRIIFVENQKTTIGRTDKVNFSLLFLKDITFEKYNIITVKRKNKQLEIRIKITLFNKALAIILTVLITDNMRLAVLIERKLLSSIFLIYPQIENQPYNFKT